MLDYIYSELNKPTKMVVWDLGRRCNYDCTYCTGWMHSTTAPMNNFERYKKTADFIDSYWKIYSDFHRNDRDWTCKISFTGGEPAINPAFYDLVPYLKEKYPYMELNLTTNGTWGKRKGQFILDTMNSITVSYHCEGTQKQKDLVRDNLLFVRKNIKNKNKMKVNVMMHMDYWDECVDLIENFLKPNDIPYIPRTIGDDVKFKSEWFEDVDGNMRRTSHVYQPDERDYIKNHWNRKNKEVSHTLSKKKEVIIPISSIKKTIAQEKEITHSDLKSIEIKPVDGYASKMGRMCCGGRCMTVKDDGKINDAMFINQSNFKGYNCMVNWFFLHIEEDKDAVYHHQTCMAKLKGSPEVDVDLSMFTTEKATDTRGPITSISGSQKYLDWLQSEFDKGKTPTIVCPNNHCGCGICIPKAKDDSDFKMIANKYIFSGEFA